MVTVGVAADKPATVIRAVAMILERVFVDISFSLYDLCCVQERRRDRWNITNRIPPGSSRRVFFYVRRRKTPPAEWLQVYALLWSHAESAVETDHRSIQHRILDDLTDKLRILLGTAEPGRKRDGLAQSDSRRSRQPRQKRSVEQAGRDRHHTDAVTGQLACDGQGHTGNAAFRRRISGLADLSVKGGDRRGVDDHAPFAFLARLGSGHGCGRQSNRVERADQVDADDARETVEGHGAVLANYARRIADAGAVDEDVESAEALDCGA